MTASMTPLVYLQKNIDGFFAEWKSLNEESKETLRQWARDEMKASKIEFLG